MIFQAGEPLSVETTRIAVSEIAFCIVFVFWGDGTARFVLAVAC